MEGTRYQSLKAARKAAGYSNSDEFAEMVGIPAATYRKYETEKVSSGCCPSTERAFKLADILGVSLDVVFGRVPYDNTTPSLAAKDRR